MRNRLIIIIPLIVIFGISIILLKQEYQKNTQQKTTLPVSKLSDNSIGAIQTDISLIIVKSEIGVDEGEGGGPLPTRITIPKTISININSKYTDLLSAYGIHEYNQIDPVVVGPKDWTGEGRMGANGNTVLSLYPLNGSTEKGPYISYYDVPACWSCYYTSAALYFPSVYEESKKNPLLNVTPIQEMKTLSISPQLVSYSLPDTVDGLEVNGVVYSGMENNKLEMPFINLQIALPKDQHDLATAILNLFIERNLLNNK